MINWQCEIDFASGPLTQMSKLKVVQVGTSGSITYQPGEYRIVGPSASQHMRAILENSKKWQPYVSGNPLQGWAQGLCEFEAFPTGNVQQVFTWSAWCIQDQAGTTGTYHPGMVGIGQVGSEWRFGVFRDNEFLIPNHVPPTPDPAGRVVGTVPLQLNTPYLWTQTHRLLDPGVAVVEGWLYDANGILLDHVAIDGDLIGIEFQRTWKIGCYNGFDYSGLIWKVRKVRFGDGNGPDPGPWI